MAGWTYTTEKTVNGSSVKAIVWVDGKILPGEFQEFEFQGKSAKEAGKYAFRVLQTYADGETVAWTGPSDAKTPASIMEVLPAAPAVANEHGALNPGTASAPGTPPPPAPAANSANSAKAVANNPLTTAAAYGGLVLGLGGVVLALRRR